MKLAGLFKSREKQKQAGSEKPKGKGFTLDMPIMPQKIVIADADIKLAANRIRLRHEDINDISFSGRIRDGFLEKAPFQAKFGKVSFKGSLGLDLREEAKKVHFKLNSKDENTNRRHR